MRSAIAAVVVVAVLGCGDERSGAEQTQVARQELTVIRSPTELATWNWAGRLVPTSAKSAYLVAFADPNDLSSFIAWGYDARGTGTALFFVRGKTAVYWSRLQDKFKADLGTFQAGGAGFDAAFTWGQGTQVYAKPKGPNPPPGGNDYSPLGLKAYDIALHLEADLQAF